MWPFEKHETVQEEVPVTTTTPIPQPTPEPKEEPKPKTPDYGDTLGQLTRFGNAWINLNEIYALDFETGDGCDCEVTLANGKTMHLDERSAEALSDYIQKH